MPAVVYAGDLTGEQLQNLVEKLRHQTQHTILERPAGICFPAPDEALIPADWSEGRMFGPSLEIRWARRGDTFRTVLTCEEESPEIELPQIETLPDPTRNTYYLWGEEDVRIGPRLEYRSIPGQGRAQLVVAEFYDAAGDLHHWRYIDMQRENES